MEAPAPARTRAGITDAERHRGLLFVGAAAAAVGFALTLQLSMNSNFIVGEIGVSGFQAGLLEAVRESCGIAALGVFAILAGLAEPAIASIVLVLVCVGLGSYAFAPGYAWVMGMSVVWSLGLHVWMPLPNSMTLALAESGKAGMRLGQIGAANALGAAGGLALALVLTLAGVRIRPLYIAAGLAAGIGALACLGVPRNIKTPGASLVFRRKYLTYYLLNFLEGWRKQIAICFAGFLLVNVYHTSLLEMLLLWSGIQAIGYFAFPRVGRLIDRVGERRILTLYYMLVTLFFIGYAFIQSRYFLYAIFVVDGATFVFATGLTTYVNKIAPKEEHTPTLGMGVAMNHIASVTMPFLGGILWTTLGFRWAFLIGLPAAAASILVVRRLPGKAAAGRR
jgi:predicted MFS family arabinose efflux permease